MEEKYKVTIIVPVYNVQDYVVECLDSIVLQTYNKSIECILVDDCGKDESVQIIDGYLKKYNGPIKFVFLHHENNKGLSAARNTGIKHANGEYVIFLDSDDKLYSNSIQSLINVANKYPEAELIQGSTYPQFLLSKNIQPESSDDIEWIRSGFCTSATIPVPAWNKLVKAQIIRDNNLYFKEGFLQEDNIWAYQLQKHIKKIAFCFDTTYWYRYNPAGIMHGASNEKEAKSFARVFNYVFDEIKQSDKIESYEIRFLEIIAEDVLRRMGADGIQLLVIKNNEIFLKLLKLSWIKFIRFKSGFMQKAYSKSLRIIFQKRDNMLRKQLCNKEILLSNFTPIDYSK